jgi:hypothetical protein
MPAHRTTTAHRLWLPLLVAFVLYVANDVSSAGDESPMFGCEPEVKSVFMEPGIDDSPFSGTQSHGNCPTLHGDDRIPVVDTVHLRNEADPITLIRGPPAGHEAPA